MGSFDDPTLSWFCVHTVSRVLCALTIQISCHISPCLEETTCKLWGKKKIFIYWVASGMIFICWDCFVGKCQLPAVQLDDKLLVVLKASIWFTIQHPITRPTSGQSCPEHSHEHWEAKRICSHVHQQSTETIFSRPLHASAFSPFSQRVEPGEIIGSTEQTVQNSHLESQDRRHR